MKLEDLKTLSLSFKDIPFEDRKAKIDQLLIDLGYDPNNIYQELEMTSKYVDTHQDMSYNNDTTQLHSHSFYEIIYARNVDHVEYLINDQRYKLQKKDILFIPYGISHRPLFPTKMNEPYIRDIIWLSKDFIDQMKHLFPKTSISNNSYLFRTLNTKWEFIGDLFLKGILENEKKIEGYEASIIGNTIHLLVEINRAINDNEILSLNAEKPDLLDQALSYIENHLNEKITLNDLSHHLFVSESTISSIFRKKLNTSFYRCLTQKRLIKAKALIHEGENLTEISSQIGFIDYSTFYRAFKQEYGISPKQYKDNYL